ncbi:MAG: hypothetical protein JSW71_06395, partial [Gemmatimonadota bacterium]
MRYVLSALFVLLNAVGLLCGCFNVRLPTTHEVEQIFVPDAEEAGEHDEILAAVPVIDSSELGGWRILCDECHIGPAYSSHTILNWGHLDVCLTGTSCLNCHGQDLHRMHVRGHKQLCYDCHLARGVSVKCRMCHTEEHVAAQEVHGPGFLGNHGTSTREGHDCMDCHGSQAWCLDCHGLEMPHPADIVEIHPDI